MNDKQPDGWVIPIHQSLTTQPLILGIKREVAIGIWGFAIALASQFWLFHFLPIAAAIHVALAYFTKLDVYFAECLFRSFKYKRFYE